MPDNDILIDGKAIALKDRSDVRWPGVLLGGALAADVLVAVLSTTTATPAFAATSVYTARVIVNTGLADAEIHIETGFAWGEGWPIAIGGVFTTSYSGAIYARTESDAGELRLWGEG